MELEYRITHSYIDKFSRPFEKNQIRLERFNKEIERSISLLESLELNKGFRLSLDSRSFFQGIDAVKKELRKIEAFELGREHRKNKTLLPRFSETESIVNWKNRIRLPEIQEAESESFIKWKNVFFPPNVETIEGSISWQNLFNEPALSTLTASIDWKNKLSFPEVKPLEIPLYWKNEFTPLKLSKLESSISWENRFEFPKIPELASSIKWKNEVILPQLQTLESSISWKNQFESPKVQDLESFVNWESKLQTPKPPKISGFIEWQNRFEHLSLEALKPEIDFKSTLRDSKKFFTKLGKLLKNILHVEPDLETKRLFRSTKVALRRLNKEFEQYEPTITPRIDESAIQKQLEELKQEISSQSFVSSISIGFGLNRLKEQLKEEGLSLSEALYESTKYGLRKSKLAYEIAQEVNKAGGYIDATEIGNNIVAALRQGVRGSEKELAYFGTVMAKFQRAFDVSAEEIGGIIYSLQRFQIPTEEFEKILGKAVALRKEFNITSETMKEIMKDIDQNFGFVMSRLDEKARAKFIVGMEELASALENSYVDSTKFMQMLSGALSGNTEDLQKAYYLTGLNLEQLRKLIESGDIQKVGESFLKQAQNLYKQYGKLAPTQQAIVAESLGIDPKEFQQILQIGKDAESFRETLQKAFEVKAESPDEVIKESTNALTRYMNIIKNKIIGFSSNLGEGFVDTVSGIFDLASSPLGAVVTWHLGSRLASRALGKLKGTGFRAGKTLLEEISEKLSVSKELEDSAFKFASMTRGSGLTSKLSGFTKGALSRVGYVGLALETVKIFTAEDKVLQAGKAAGSGVGGWAGAEIGAAIGTAIAPGIGTAIGAALGGLVGAFTGSEIGGWLTEKIRGIFTTPEVKPQTQIGVSRTSEKPSEKTTLPKVTLQTSQQKAPEDKGLEEKLLTEIRDSLWAIQELIARAYQQKLLTPEGVSLPSIDPFEQWRKN